MYPRTEYEMTEADLAAILDACKPTPVMMIGGSTGSTPQENANRAWAALGARIGFDHMTVRPIDGKGNRFFTAVPSETTAQRGERLLREAAAKKDATISRLRAEIEERERHIVELQEMQP